jgi:hypothetical protein
MVFRALWTPAALDAFNALRDAAEAAAKNRDKSGAKKASKAEGLFKQVEKCVGLLTTNPRHPGLRTHQYHSLPHPYDPKEKVFEAYVQNDTPGAYRLFWCYGPRRDEMTIIAITPHP